MVMEQFGTALGNKQQKDATSSYISESAYFRYNRVCAGFCRYSTSGFDITDRVFGCHKIINENHCVCGRDRDAHGFESNGENEVVKWHTKVSVEHPNRSFGEIKFSTADGIGVANASQAKFLRLSVFSSFQANSDEVKAYKGAIVQLMFDYWNMPKPRLIVEVAGTIRRSEINGDQLVEESIKMDVVEAAGHAGAWIVTSGENGGIMRLIGDAVAKYNCINHGSREIACLAITNWQEVVSKGADDAREAIEMANGGTKTYVVDEENFRNLNHGHNYALMVDNSRVSGFGDSTYFRHELTNYIAEQVGNQGSVKAKIPIVLLAAGGGPGTLAILENCFGVGDARYAVPKPVVIYFGFGGVTDLIATILTENPGLEGNRLQELVRAYVPTYLPYLDLIDGQTYVGEIVERITKCIEKAIKESQKIIVFKVGNGKLSDVIEKAAAGVHKDDAFISLKLALHWNLPWLAKDLLESMKIQEKPSHSDARTIKLAADVVRKGNLEFLNFFKKHQFIRKHHHQFLSNFATIDIYERSLEKLASIYGKNSKSLSLLGQAFDNDIGCFSVDILEDLFLKDCSISVSHRNVFLLQLALNHREVADYFWSTGNDPLGTSLIASLFLDSLSKRMRRLAKEEYATFRENDNLANDFAQQSQKWEDRAYRLLDACIVVRRNKVPEQLNRRLSTWQGLSVFEIATYGRCRRFASHDAVFTQMGFILYGSVVPYNNPFLFILSIFLPFLFSPSLSYFSLETVKLPSLSCEKVEPLFADGGKQKPGYLDCLIAFVSAPVLKFVYHTTSMACYILLFSAFVLQNNLDPNGVSLHEGLVLAWTGAILIDSAYETYVDDARILARKKHVTAKKKMVALISTILERLNIFRWDKAYFAAAILPLVMALLLVTAFVLRMTLKPVDFVYPHTCYILVCMLMWLRSITIFRFWPTTGQIVAILFEMTPILFSFLLVYILLLLSFAIPIYSIMAASFTVVPTFSNGTLGSDAVSWEVLPLHDRVRSFFQLFAKVVYDRWWNLVGIGLDDARGAVEGVCHAKCDDCKTSPPTALDYDCSTVQFNVVGVVLFIVFIFLTNVVWMNCLIATLSDMVTSKREATNEQARFHFMVAVKTLYYRTIMPVPLNIFEIIIRIFASFINSSVTLPTNGNTFNFKYPNDEQIRLDELERFCAEKVLADEKVCSTST